MSMELRYQMCVDGSSYKQGCSLSIETAPGTDVATVAPHDWQTVWSTTTHWSTSGLSEWSKADATWWVKEDSVARIRWVLDSSSSSSSTSNSYRRRSSSGSVGFRSAIDDVRCESSCDFGETMLLPSLAYSFVACTMFAVYHCGKAPVFSASVVLIGFAVATARRSGRVKHRAAEGAQTSRAHSMMVTACR